MKLPQKAKEYLIKQYPAEAGGLLLKNGHFIELKNLSSEPALEFSSNSKEFFDRLHDIDYFIHTHTRQAYKGIDPRAPSKRDMLAQEDLQVPFAIYYTDGESLSEPVFFGEEDIIRPLLNREFIHNASDCWELARDAIHMILEEEFTLDDILYFKDPFILQTQHIVPNVPRSPNWLNEGDDVFGQYKELGFEDTNNPLAAEPGDLLLMKIDSNTINHCAVYVGEEQIIHILPNRPAKVDSFYKWAKAIVKRVKLK